MSPERPPSSLGARGTRFWRKVMANYELNAAERELLIEACRVLTLLDKLEAKVARAPVVPGSSGQPRTHPALAEIRAQRTQLTQLFAALELPEDEAVTTPRQARARKAAESRWAHHRAIRGLS